MNRCPQWRGQFRYPSLNDSWSSQRGGLPIRAVSACRRVRDAKRIEGPAHDWRLPLNANPFLVTRAVNRCAATIRAVLASIEGGERIDRTELIERLRLNVRGAVATPNGDEYRKYYPVRGTNMPFGAHSIDVDDFAREAIKAARLEELDLIT